MATSTRDAHLVQQFNAAWGVGTPVRYFSVDGQPEFTEHLTRTSAWVSESGHAVIMISDKRGYVALSHIEIDELRLAEKIREVAGGA